MEDLIDRQAAIDALAGHEKSRGHNYTLFVDIVSECAEIIRNLPSADAQPIRHGKWVHCDDGSLSWRCSVCGKHAYGNYAEVFSGEYHFCPNCGARMDGEA